MKPFWFPAGDSALLLDFQGFKPTKKNYFAKDEEKIYYSNKVNLISSHLQNLLNKNKLHGITEIVPGIASILIHYDLSLVSYYDVKNKIELHINNSKNIIKSKQRLWRIPVLYGGIHGPDLKNLSITSNLTEENLIKIHTSKRLQITIMGFLPGLGYMSGLDKIFNIPRLCKPRTFVPKGTVAIAMQQTVIYPLNSPGGWHLIGKTPIVIFEPKKNNPILFRPGDFVEFFSITDNEYEKFLKNKLEIKFLNI